MSDDLDPVGSPAEGDDPTPRTTPDPPSGATGASRTRPGRGRGPGRTWALVIGGVAAVLVVAVIALVTTSGTDTAAAKPKPKPAPTTTTAAPAPPPPTCPLTGTPPPGGKVPARPALGVKIGNYPGDRPSAGLNQADLVVEEPVEGAITRLVAVFQCQAPTLVGDMRSARQPDVAIMSQLSDPIFAHAGGIDPVIALLREAPLTDENVLGGAAAGAAFHQPGRVAPYATFTNTASLWALDPSDTTPPAPIFAYSPTLPAGTVPASGGSAHIPFSSSSDVTWTWNPAATNYLRAYSGAPDILLDGTQTAANNVVIMTVQTSTGAWVENDEGGHEVLVPPTGSGPLVVLRNGAAITGTWTRTTTTGPTALVAANGAPITLQPGNTWEELVPAGVAVTTTPAPAPAPAAPTK